MLATPLGWESSRSEFEKAAEFEIVNRFDYLARTLDLNSRAQRLADGIVVKKIDTDGRQEYVNQYLAWRVLNGPELRVPEPIRFFEYSSESGLSSGYLVMEYLRGVSLDQAQSKINVEAATNAIRFLHARSRAMFKPGTSPGALTRTFTDGFPWGQNGVSSPFGSVEGLERCANRRLICYARNKNLAAGDWAIDLKQKELTMCHMDLALRNIMMLQDGGVGIVDWSTLAWYPMVFELASLAHLAHLTPPHQRDLAMALYRGMIRATSSLAEDAREVQRDILKLEIVQGISTRYLF